MPHDRLRLRGFRLHAGLGCRGAACAWNDNQLKGAGKQCQPRCILPDIRRAHGALEPDTSYIKSGETASPHLAA